MMTPIQSLPRRRVANRLQLRLPLGRIAVVWGASWLIVAPAGLWATKTIYVPTLGAFLDQPQAWAVTVLIALLIGLSLFAHAAAHAGAYAAARAGSHAGAHAAARASSHAAAAGPVGAGAAARVPMEIPLYLLGDAAQVWPAASTPGREAAVALAGPLASALLACGAFLIWNAQLHPYLNVAMPLAGVFNAVLAIVNLAPAFPFDGGRLARALGWRLLDRPASITRLAVRLGHLLAAALAAWGVVLFAQRARFSLETALAAAAWSALILLPLAANKAWQWDRALGDGTRRLRFMPARYLLVALAMAGLLALPAGLAPLNDGLQAPGTAVATEPMVETPPDRRYPSSGSYILTTVIQQAPIVLAEWLAGQVIPSVVHLMPPEQVVPPDTTMQEQARQGFRMLDESEAAAVVVGLRLAGYDARAEAHGALVESVLPDSPSRALLQPGDAIVGLDGQAIQTTSDLTRQLSAKRGGDTVRLQIQRDGEDLDVTVPLMPPSAPGGAPRIGIAVAPARFDYTLPFPVRIVPQKIVGGPSAGLMFALTVYDLVTPGDLTGGRKIAGTGTISLDGSVGPIGGVERKVVAAELAGAEYFLSPPENYAAACAAARRIKVVEVATAEQAIAFLAGL